MFCFCCFLAVIFKLGGGHKPLLWPIDLYHFNFKFFDASLVTGEPIALKLANRAEIHFSFIVLNAGKLSP